MMKDEEGTLPGIPDDASITNPSRPPIRLRGSHSSQQLMQAVALPRRPRDGEDDEPPSPLPPPPPPVSTPDLALQISFRLAPELNDAVVTAVRQAIDPNADVRTAYISGTQRIGIWLRPFVNYQDNQARDRGLQRLQVIGAGEQMAFFINSALVRRKALDGWNAAQKRLNGDGAPDPTGPVHLTGFSLSFESPNQVIARVDGFDERPWPDVDFQITSTDTLSVSGGQIHCDSERKLDIDTSWLNFLAGLFLIVLPPLGIVFLVERIIVGSKDAPDPKAGPGCDAAAMVPREILIPGGLKVVPSYSRVEVSSGGIFAGGSFEVIDRAPLVTIAGPTQVAAVEGATSLNRNYSLRTDDLRPPLRIRWSGEGFAVNPSAETTGMRFNLTGTQVDQVLTRRVSVQVTDADNLTASSELIVHIHITPADEDDFPPVCRVKPWLPQCQEPLARAARSRRREQP